MLWRSSKTKKNVFILIGNYSGGGITLAGGEDCKNIILMGSIQEGKYFRKEKNIQKVLGIEKDDEGVIFIIGKYSGSNRVNTWQGK